MKRSVKKVGNAVLFNLMREKSFLVFLSGYELKKILNLSSKELGIDNPIEILKQELAKEEGEILVAHQTEKTELQKTIDLRSVVLENLSRVQIIGGDKTQRIKFQKEADRLEVVCGELTLSIEEKNKSILMFEKALENLDSSLYPKTEAKASGLPEQTGGQTPAAQGAEIFTTV